MAKKKYYAVKKGLCPGIYFSWDDCRQQVEGYPGALYKSFPLLEEAEAYISGNETSAKQQITADAIAYVDGSFNVATGEYGAGVVFMYQGQVEKMSQKGTDEELATMRNVAGEILGAQLAMERGVELGLQSLVIYHDYQGIASWCLGEWKTNKEGTKAYKAYFDSIKDSIKVTFQKVKGHSGDQYNDMADELAKSSIF